MYVWDDKKKQYVSDTPASRIPVKDSAELFDSNNVEGALAELAGERDAQGITLQDHTGKIENLSEAVDWLKVNGGGRGGGGAGGIVMPTITTSDELNQIVPKGQEIVINVFFASPNLGGGALIVLINNKEAGSYTLRQGMNTINLGKLDALRNKIVVYAKDRANLMSNDLTYNIINGGVSLTLDFDYYADYPADKDILMRYTIDTDQTDIQLDVTVDNNKSSVKCKNGYNEYYFKNLTVGIHAVTVKAVSGQFISETYSFNLVVINSDSLYISSTFGENPKCTLGVPVVIDYRISYKDDTAITLVLTLDGKVNKTLTSKRGSYAWTLNDMTLGSHSYKIDCTLGADTVSLEGTFVVEAGDYTPLQINTDGLRYQMRCANRTNQDDDKEQFIYDNGTSQITTTLHGFNFETNGWIDGTLVCNGGAYAEIDYACMAENAPYSLTVEIDFKATDIGIHDARVLECRDTDTKKGFHVALTEAKLNSISQEAKVYITPEERTTVSLQIDRQNKFAKIYVNGIITSAFKLTDSGSGTATVLESFAHNGKIYVGCDKNLDNIGNCTIYDIRVYERRVSNDEIVKNVIAQEKDLRKQEDLYNFCFNNNTLSTMRLYSDEVENKVENMTNTNKITMRAVYRSTNTEKYGQPFELKYCKVYWQGTSSLDYIRKNYNLELYDDDLREFYYSPYPNGVQEYLFCLKCDYMESSHARNVGIGNLINKYWYTSKNPAQLKDDKVQNAVQGFPMLLYINDEFMGVYNFNTDRYSNASFGYTGDNCLAYELSANSDTTAGAFITYDKTKHEGNEIDYYKRDFMCLYPPTRRAGNDTMDEIIDLVKFVDKSSDEEFVTNINNNVYFNKEYLLRYLIYCLVMGAVDSLGKNMKLATWDMGKTWYPQIYDCDTTMGLDNSGMLYYTDSSMKIQAGTYNTSSSRLWSRLMELMWADIQAEYVKMRNTYLTLDNLYSCIIDNQMDLIPATYYNSDCETKYLQFGALYLDVLHGQGKQQVMEWLRARLLFLDTYMEYWTTTSEFISLRAGKDGLAYIDLEMFDNMYAQIKWRNTGKEDDALAIQIKEVKKNTVTRFEFKVQASTDQEIRIFGANYVKSLGDLSNLELVKIDVSNATRLTKMECHSSKLKNVILSTCTNLQHVDLKDCSTLGSTEQSTKNLDVSNCSNLKYVNCQNTQLQGITLNPNGSNIKEVWYPKSIQTVSFANCPQLETVGLEEGHSCNELRLVNCPNVIMFGDRNYSDTYKDYLYNNSKFLNGVQNIYIDASCLGFTEWEMKDCNKGFTSIVIKNIPNMKKLILGVNNTKEDVYYTKGTDFGGKNLSDLLAKKDCTIELSNTGITELIFTAFQRKSYSPNMRNGIEYDYSGTPNTYHMGSFSAKSLDLSNTKLEKVKFLCCCDIYKVLVPSTLTDLVADSFFDMHDKFHGASGSENDYDISFENHHYKAGKDNLVLTSSFGSKSYGVTTQGLGGNARLPNACSGSTLWKVWCPNNTEEPTDVTDATGTLAYTWDLKGLKLNTCWLWNLNCAYLYQNGWSLVENRIEEAINYYVLPKNMYNEYKIQIRNMDLKCKEYQLLTYPRAFYIEEPYVGCTVDYTEFTGMALNFGFAYTKKLNYVMPKDLEAFVNTPTYIYKPMYKLESNIIGWNFVEAVNKRTIDAWELRDIIQYAKLKEQTEEEAIDLTVNIPSNWYPLNMNFNTDFSYKLMYGSNLKYLKNLRIKGYLRTRGLLSSSGLVKVQNIEIQVSTPGDSDCSSEMFRDSKDLISVGNINITFPTDAPICNVGRICGERIFLAYMYYGCSNLVSVGDVTGNRPISEVYQYLNSSNVNMVESADRAFFNCSKLESIGDLSYLNPVNIGDMLSGCSSLKTVKKLPNLSRICTSYNAFKEVTIDLSLEGLDSNLQSVSFEKFFMGYLGKHITGMYIPVNIYNTRHMYSGAKNLILVEPEGHFTEEKHANCAVTSMYQMYVGCRGEMLPSTIIVPKKVTECERMLEGIKYDVSSGIEHTLTIKILGSKLTNFLHYQGAIAGLTTLNMQFQETLEGTLDMSWLGSYNTSANGVYFKNLNINWDKIPRCKGAFMLRDNQCTVNLNYYDLNTIWEGSGNQLFYFADINPTWHGTASHDLCFAKATISTKALTALIPLLEKVESAKLYLGTTSKNRLTNEQKAEITAKGWTIV